MKSKGLLIGLGIFVGIIVIGIIMLVGSYNGFVKAEEDVNNKWSQVDNQLQRRADLIPNLVETVKGYASHEKEAIDSVTEARAKLSGASNPSETIDANNELTSALNRLMVVVENYPDLKANENFIGLMDSLEGTENRIAVARKDYNDVVTQFNKKVKMFPGVILANIFGFDEKDYFEVSEEDREVPEVDFGSGE